MLGAFLPAALTTIAQLGSRNVRVIATPNNTFLLPITAAPGQFEIFQGGAWRPGSSIGGATPDEFTVLFGGPTVPVPTRVRYSGGPPFQLDGFGVQRLGAFDLPLPFP